MNVFGLWGSGSLGATADGVWNTITDSFILDDDYKSLALIFRFAGNSACDIQGVDNLSVNAVPEPATMLLLGSGLVGLAGLGRKKFRKK